MGISNTVQIMWGSSDHEFKKPFRGAPTYPLLNLRVKPCPPIPLKQNLTVLSLSVYLAALLSLNSYVSFDPITKREEHSKEVLKNNLPL
jgi:hypothetical protein